MAGIINPTDDSLYTYTYTYKYTYTYIYIYTYKSSLFLLRLQIQLPNRGLYFILRISYNESTALSVFIVLISREYQGLDPKLSKKQ